MKNLVIIGGVGLFVLFGLGTLGYWGVNSLVSYSRTVMQQNAPLVATAEQAGSQVIAKLQQVQIDPTDLQGSIDSLTHTASESIQTAAAGFNWQACLQELQNAAALSDFTIDAVVAQLQAVSARCLTSGEETATQNTGVENKISTTTS